MQFELHSLKKDWRKRLSNVNEVTEEDESGSTSESSVLRKIDDQVESLINGTNSKTSKTKKRDKSKEPKDYAHLILEML